MKRAVRWAIRVVLTAVVTLFFFRSLRVSARDVTTLDWTRWTPDPLWLALSTALLLTIFLFLVALWVRLLHRLGTVRIRFGAAVRIFFLSQLARYIPGRVWQLAGLAYLARQEGIAPGIAAFSAILIQAFGLTASVLLGSLYLPFGPGGSWGWSALALGGLAIGGLIALSRPPISRKLVGKLLRRGGEPPGTSASELGGLPFVFSWLGLHLAAWLGYSVAFCMFWASFRPLEGGDVLIVATAFPAAYVLGYAAFFAPAGIGVREGALAALTAPLLGAADATAFALITRAWTTIAEMLPVLWALTGASGARLWKATQR